MECATSTMLSTACCSASESPFLTAPLRSSTAAMTSSASAMTEREELYRSKAQRPARPMTTSSAHAMIRAVVQPFPGRPWADFRSGAICASRGSVRMWEAIANPFDGLVPPLTTLAEKTVLNLSSLPQLCVTRMDDAFERHAQEQERALERSSSLAETPRAPRQGQRQKTRQRSAPAGA